MHCWKWLPACGLITGAVLALSASASAQTTYFVTIQAPATVTTLPNGTVAFLFDSGGSGSRTATATLSSITYSSDYATDGYSTFGTATAPIGGTGTISNDPAQSVNGFSTDASPFGRTLRFTLSFSGAALTPTTPYAATGSDFAVELFDAQGLPLWTPDAQGRVLDLPLNPNGTLGPAQLFGTTATITAAPEASSSLALGVGTMLLLGLAFQARRRGQYHDDKRPQADTQAGNVGRDYSGGDCGVSIAGSVCTCRPNT